MHVVLTTACDDDATTTKQWAPLSLPDNIADSNGTLLLPTILSMRAGGGLEGGRGLRTSYSSATEGAHRDTGFFLTTRCACLQA